MSVCGSCRTGIRWVTMEGSGKAMPLDLEPDVDKGTIYVSNGTRLIGRVMTGEDLELARKGDAPLFVSHFATCPNAKKHRRAA